MPNLRSQFKYHALEHKIDFVIIVKVSYANPNGDPMNNNRPRTTPDGYGLITSVCIKRKLRNCAQDRDENIFVQMEEKCTDGCKSLSERFEKYISKDLSQEEVFEKVCELWFDVRAFGQTFAFKSASKKGKSSFGVRGPVSIHPGISCSPVEVIDVQITKSVDGESSSDRIGKKSYIPFALYKIKGSINVQLAEKTHFSQEDAEVIKETLKNLFLNDASAARPEGSMEVLNLYWFEHNNKTGQYPSSKVHDSVKVILKDGIVSPRSEDDYDITLEPLDGLVPEVWNL